MTSTWKVPTLTALAATAAIGLSAVPGPASAATSDRGSDPSYGVHRAMQRDADRILDYGAPGVLARLDTPHGAVVVRSGEGNVRRHTPVPRNAHFRIGSFTKTFVSATVLQLVGEHRLSLDDTVDRWLPGLVRGHGNDGRKITVRQLLQHTSGLPDYVQGLPFVSSRAEFEKHRFDSISGRQAVKVAMRYDHVFAPGTSWSYSNTNYALAGLVIRAVTGHSWRHEVRERIIEPLGLRDTSIPGNDPRIPGPHAHGYERFPGPDATPEHPDYGAQIDATLQNPSWGGAAGEIISTPRDANHFLRALVRGKVLHPAQLRQMMHTVPVDKDFDSYWPGARYGLGLIWIPNSCGGMWAHGGDIPGFLTRDGVSADGRRSVVVSVNTDSPKPKAGTSLPTVDLATGLIDDALCGR